MAILKVLRSSRKACKLLTTASKSCLSTTAGNNSTTGGNTNNLDKKSTFVDTTFHEVNTYYIDS